MPKLLSAIGSFVTQTLTFVRLSLSVVCLLLVALYLARVNAPEGPYISSHQVLDNLPLLVPSDNIIPSKSLVRIFIDGDFYCSGAVVGKNYVITAAHCLVNGNGVMRKDAVVHIENMATGEVVKAKIAGVNTRMDWGLIIGDFSRMPGANVAYNVTDTPLKMLACGYPHGSATLHCTEIMPVINDGFEIKGIGQLYPGMSGGPVFTPAGVIAGINTLAYPAAEGGGMAYTPTIGIFASFGIADTERL